MWYGSLGRAGEFAEFGFVAGGGFLEVSAWAIYSWGWCLWA